MLAKILNFVKTSHFLLRQWERSIGDKILLKVVPFIQKMKRNKKMTVIITPLFLAEIGITYNQCIILILKKNLLITCYTKDLSECLFGNTKFINPQFI